MGTWRHDLPDYYAGMDLWEQQLSDRERARVARDADNLSRGQLVHLGSRWVEIWSTTPDRFGRVEVFRDGMRHHEYPSVIKEAARRARELEDLRQAADMKEAA